MITLSTFVAALVVFGTVTLLLSLGVLAGRRPIQGSCGGGGGQCVCGRPGGACQYAASPEGVPAAGKDAASTSRGGP